jgi:imidazolonepropionase
MNFVLSLACLYLKMTPEEAINAATVNSAFALELDQTHGSITKGKAASVFITEEMPSYEFITYSFGTNSIDTVILEGKVYDGN